ncbi:MAG: 30S ribosome-binding factor RbfA [Gammaproteobacteria bacterium]
MPREREFSRLDRVASTMKRVLASPLGEIARTEGAGLVSITAVDVTSDMRHASVSLSVFGEPDEAEAFVKRLRGRASELQHVLAREMRTKRTPVLSFKLDDAIARADRINRLLGSDEPGEAFD